MSNASKADALRHLDGINVVFTDGHSKWYKSADQNGTSRAIYNRFTGFSISGNSPTFNYNRP